MTEMKLLAKRVKELEKENAELKERLELLNLNANIAVRDLNDLLTKAKEIIKKFTEFVNNKIEYDPEHPQEHTDKWNELCKQAEQFLKNDGCPDVMCEDCTKEDCGVRQLGLVGKVK